jgi:hypothetical protein
MRQLDPSNYQDRLRSFGRIANLVMLTSAFVVLLLVASSAIVLDVLFDKSLSFGYLTLLGMALLVPVSATLDQVMFRKTIQRIYNTPPRS